MIVQNDGLQREADAPTELKEYEETSHCSFVSSMLRSWPIVGREIETAVLFEPLKAIVTMVCLDINEETYIDDHGYRACQDEAY